MKNKAVGVWGGARSVRLEPEFRDIGVNAGDKVEVTVRGREIIIKKIKGEKNEQRR